jgi:MFS family permease
VYPLIQGQSLGWPIWTSLMIVASLVTFGLLVEWTRRSRRAGRDPLVEASIFSHRSYVAGLGGIVVFFAGMIGTLLVLTLYLQFGEHFSAIHAGLTLAPFAVGTAAGATLAATVLVPRFGRTVLQVGAVVIGGGIWWLREVIVAHGLATTSLSLAPPQIVLGLGIGMLISPLFGFILASVTDDEVGSASGVLNACQQLAGAVGVAVLGTIFFAVLGHAGFVAAATRCLLVELGTMPVLVVLTGLLPRQARADEFPPDPVEVPRPATTLAASATG